MGQYRHHVFVCTSGKTCPTQGSKEVFDHLRKGVLERKLKGAVRINHAGCMGQCGHGPMVAVYPDDVWYSGVDLPLAQQILERHLEGNAAIEEARYVAPPGDNKIPGT